ncbi:family 43 glycosylhydrolase [Parafilimonas sp.]|uniref:family 43 glycosylhydrolase n=1 Tax=Parafilimonas sp. TaxID=1969739 RepID=UPI0039E63697
MKKNIFIIIVFIGCMKMQAAAQANNNKLTAYLFAYFTGNDKSEEAIHFAISKDGYHYYALNDDRPVITSDTISETGGVRDPHILRGADGKTFYMVATDMVSANGWNSNRAMVLLKSGDLIHWSHAVINIQKTYPNQEKLERVWAPQTIYDAAAKKYMVYWAMKYEDGSDKIYYAYTNKDFTALEGAPKQLFFSPGNKSCIDADIAERDGVYHLFFKTEGHGNGIKQAVSKNLTHGYVMQDAYLQQTTKPVEGSGTFKLNDGSGYILMYDMYTSGRYQFTFSKDLEHFKAIDNEISMNFHPRHGTVMPITNAEAERLLGKWFNTDALAGTASSPSIKKINVELDTANAVLSLPVQPGTDLKEFDPQFLQLPGINITPKGAVDFTKGAVTYTLQIAGTSARHYKVNAVVNGNALFNGLYADPEVLYAHKTNKYYIYPTSDGFTGWSGTYFKTFSSPDLVNWKDEGVILDLGKDVSWANRNAWAPTIIEKKINGQYKYFYYFCAAQKIGAAAADDPAGPFTDAGKPLITSRPAGVKGGQEIDPDVFEDPVTGKDYLYWGNGYMAVAALNKDMISIDTNSITIITPDNTFREGTEVLYRKGKYYFMWSEDDTRSPNYRVRYGYSDSPTGKIIVPQNNIVIEKDTTQGIYGTGHNCVLNIPGTDEWYIIYHRFNRPKGISMGDAAGFNREVCIDKLVFNEDGSIQQVKPTLTGITEPVAPKLKNE